mmetsp:Transcript_6966/g.17399  ORF Transcript_6966/g.17399 Transcript_6966/m.17399 type:complete len:97 (-) Transcript_6966:81-371(-)
MVSVAMALVRCICANAQLQRRRKTRDSWGWLKSELASFLSGGAVTAAWMSQAGESLGPTVVFFALRFFLSCPLAFDCTYKPTRRLTLADPLVQDTT